MKQEAQHQRLIEAEFRASHWLAEANRLKESGKSDEKACSKAQFWLDRANALRDGCH